MEALAVRATSLLHWIPVHQFTIALHLSNSEIRLPPRPLGNRWAEGIDETISKTAAFEPLSIETFLFVRDFVETYLVTRIGMDRRRSAHKCRNYYKEALCVRRIDASMRNRC